MSDVPASEKASFLGRIVRFCLEQKLVVFLLLALTIGWGLRVAPFDWDLGALPRDPVAVDAIPDIGENQQIVFTKWDGRSPQDVEDQVTYPLTVALLGVPGVRTVRSFSMFGFSSIYVIFTEEVEFYWSRSAAILEKLASLPARHALPDGVEPAPRTRTRRPLGQVLLVHARRPRRRGPSDRGRLGSCTNSAPCRIGLVRYAHRLGVDGVSRGRVDRWLRPASTRSTSIPMRCARYGVTSAGSGVQRPCGCPTSTSARGRSRVNRAGVRDPRTRLRWSPSKISSEPPSGSTRTSRSTSRRWTRSAWARRSAAVRSRLGAPRSPAASWWSATAATRSRRSRTSRRRSSSRPRGCRRRRSWTSPAYARQPAGGLRSRSRGFKANDRAEPATRRSGWSGSGQRRAERLARVDHPQPGERSCRSTTAPASSRRPWARSIDALLRRDPGHGDRRDPR